MKFPLITKFPSLQGDEWSLVVVEYSLQSIDQIAELARHMRNWFHPFKAPKQGRSIEHYFDGDEVVVHMENSHLLHVTYPDRAIGLGVCAVWQQAGITASVMFPEIGKVVVGLNSRHSFYVYYRLDRE